MEMEWDFADRLERARAWRGWTQTELARRAGVHQVQVHKLLHGRKPRVQGDTIRKLAIALGVSGDYLLGLSDDMNPQPLPLPYDEAAEEKGILGAVAQLVGA
jgi:transcriptional regulator with XRE-family HTH domain